MFMLPVDLFSPFIKGREYAIDRNWNDLNQANQVEGGWIKNDRGQLENWFAQDTYDDRLATSNANARVNQNAASASDLDLQVANVRQPGLLSQTQSQSDYAQQLANAMAGYLPTIAGNQATANLGQSAVNAAQANVAQQYAPQLYSGNAQNQIATQNFNLQMMNQQLQQQRANAPVQQMANQVRTKQLQAILNGEIPLFNNPTHQTATQATGNTQPMFPQPGGVGTPPSVLDFQNTLNRLPAGTESEIEIGGVKYKGGKDAQGMLYIISNGQRNYLGGQANQPAQLTQQQVFSFGGD